MGRSIGSNSSRSFKHMVQLTEKAIGKVRGIMASQTPAPAGLRISVVGGGCSGFSYSMAFENAPNMLDKTYNYGELKVFVDQARSEEHTSELQSLRHLVCRLLV